MRTRDTRHTAKLRGTSLPPWRTRACRRCPADASGFCLIWRVEVDGGRWDRKDAPHVQRRTPGTAKCPPFVVDEIELCADASRHGYHYVRPGVWCRGRI